MQAANLSIIDWEQPARFVELNERFGPWGLALLEAIVRRADHTGLRRGSGERTGGDLMAEVICPGIPASWLNAWLAAVGATVVDSRIRLRWTTGRTPAAVLVADEVDPVEALAASWPDRGDARRSADCRTLG